MPATTTLPIRDLMSLEFRSRGFGKELYSHKFPEVASEVEDNDLTRHLNEEFSARGFMKSVESEGEHAAAAPPPEKYLTPLTTAAMIGAGILAAKEIGKVFKTPAYKMRVNRPSSGEFKSLAGPSKNYDAQPSDEDDQDEDYAISPSETSSIAGPGGALIQKGLSAVTKNAAGESKPHNLQDLVIDQVSKNAAGEDCPCPEEEATFHAQLGLPVPEQYKMWSENKVSRDTDGRFRKKKVSDLSDPTVKKGTKSATRAAGVAKGADEPSTTEQIVLAALQEGPLTLAELAEVTKISQANNSPLVMALASLRDGKKVKSKKVDGKETFELTKK